MTILGHGVDLVDTERIARMLDEHGQRFLDRCFTADEQAYAGDKRRRVEHLAGRFAAKEAVLKALGTGLIGSMRWTDIQIVREPSGRPRVELTGQVREVAGRAGVDRWWISLSHTDRCAMASVIAERTGGLA